MLRQIFVSQSCRLLLACVHIPCAVFHRLSICTSGSSLKSAARPLQERWCCLHQGRSRLVRLVTQDSLSLTPPPVNLALVVSTQMEQVQYTRYTSANMHVSLLGLCYTEYYHLLTACDKCPVGTEPVVGLEYKWWNTMPSNMISSVLGQDFRDSDHRTGERLIQSTRQQSSEGQTP